METHEAEARLAERVVMQEVGGAAPRIDRLFSEHRSVLHMFDDLVTEVFHGSTSSSIS